MLGPGPEDLHFLAFFLGLFSKIPPKYPPGGFHNLISPVGPILARNQYGTDDAVTASTVGADPGNEGETYTG
jgi:hypothetical protein